MNKKTTKEKLEELCLHKGTAGSLDECKPYCVKCDGYDKLCSNYCTSYGKRLSEGFQIGGENEK